MFMADVMYIKEVSSFLVKGELPSMVDLLPTFMGSSRLTISFRDAHMMFSFKYMTCLEAPR